MLGEIPSQKALIALRVELAILKKQCSFCDWNRARKENPDLRPNIEEFEQGDMPDFEYNIMMDRIASEWQGCYKEIERVRKMIKKIEDSEKPVSAIVEAAQEAERLLNG